MMIEPRYQIWKIARRDKWSENRPILTHVLIERIGDSENGLAIASDGFCMAIAPVTLAADDVPGVVRGDLFALAARAKSWLGLRAEAVLFEDGTLYPRTWTIKPGQAYPDWRRAAKKAECKPALNPTFALDPVLFGRLREALGIKVGKDGAMGARFTIAAPNAPILIEAMGDGRKEGVLTPPYGYLMPMHTPVLPPEERSKPEPAPEAAP